MMLSNLSVPLVGVVDTAVIGHLSEPDSLAAVAVGATIFSFLYLGLNFLRMGTTGVTAQAMGRADRVALRTALAQGWAVAALLAGALLAAQWPLRWLGLELIAPASGVRMLAGVYFDVRIWAAPAVLVDYVLVGWFLGLGDAKAALALALVVNIANAVLDVLFVSGMGMGVRGVALGSVAAEYAGLIVGAVMMFQMLRSKPATWHWRQVFDQRSMKKLASLNGNLLVRTLCVMVGFGFFTAMSARLGTVILAANAVLLNLQNVTSYALDGLAHAVEALAGQAAGRGDTRILRHAVRMTTAWSVAIAAVFAVVYAVGGRAFIRSMTNLPAVNAAAVAYLPWMIAAPLVGVWAFELDGVFVGITRAREMRNAMLAALACYIGVWFAARPWGNHGLWLALIAFMAARGIFMGLTYQHLQRTNRLIPKAASDKKQRRCR